MFFQFRVNRQLSVAAVGIVKIGEVEIILSTYDIIGLLNDDRKSAAVVRKLFYNYLVYSSE